MQVSNIIEQVARGDLRQTSLSDIGTTASRTEMQQSNLDTLVGFVNQGVLELHKRFPIKVSVEDEVIKAPTPTDDPIVLPDTALELISITVDDATYVPNGELGPFGVVVPTNDYYVAYRGFSTVPSVTPVGDTGLNYKKKFEDSCLRIEQNTDTLYEWANPKRLVERGFV